MDFRPCNDDNELFNQIRFGVMFGASANSGIPIFTAYGITVYFQGLAFDSAGTLKVTRTVPSDLPYSKISPTLNILLSIR